MAAEREKDAVVGKLLGHSGVAAESVPDPWHRRAAFLFDGEDYVEGLDHMQYQWFAQRFRQGDVAAENVGLRVDAGSAQTVYARLAYGCDRRMCCGALKQFEIRCRTGLPRMYAHGIMLAFFWTEEGRTHADDCIGACGVVCVAVDEHRLWYRVIAASAPRMAAADALHGKPRPFQRSVFADGFYGILRACGRVAACRWKHRGDGGLIESYQRRQKPCEQLSHHWWSVCCACEIPAATALKMACTRFSIEWYDFASSLT